jgi:hypothetical protein
METVVAAKEAQGSSSEDNTEIQTIVTWKKVGWLLFLPFCGVCMLLCKQD